MRNLTFTAYHAGLFDAGCRILPDRLVIYSRSPRVITRLHTLYGGSMEHGCRWVLRGRTRLDVLAAWMEHSEIRPLEVLEAYEELHLVVHGRRPDECG